MSDSFGSNDKLGDSPAVELMGKIMVIVTIILFMVVVFSILIHLYARLSWRRIDESTAPQPPSHRRRRFVFVPGQDPAIYDDQRSGLDPAVLRSLSVLVFQPEDFKDGLECAVCLSELVQGEKARLLPSCNHGFHVDCIDMWLQSHSTCPLCRYPVASESSKSRSSLDAREDVSESSQSSTAETSSAMTGSESPNFPTNMLIWGNQTSIGASLDEEGLSPQPSCSSSSTSSSSSAGSTRNSNRRHGMLIIDIPSEMNPSSLSPSACRFAEDELKSPMTPRLRSLKRLLSWGKRSSPCSPGSIDMEQAGRGQS